MKEMKKFTDCVVEYWDEPHAFYKNWHYEQCETVEGAEKRARELKKQGRYHVTIYSKFGRKKHFNKDDKQKYFIAQEYETIKVCTEIGGQYKFITPIGKSYMGVSWRPSTGKEWYAIATRNPREY